MEGQFSFKTFENVRLKATYVMESGNRIFQPGETIALFDSIQIAGLNESISRVSANGGFDNRARVFWETSNDVKLTFAQGVFNKTAFGLLLNAKMFDSSAEEEILITKREILESDEYNKFVLSFMPINPIFVYDKATGNPIPFTIENKEITIDAPYKEVIVDYNYNYTGNALVYKLGQHWIAGFVELEGTTRVKDDTTGQVVTGLIKIPRLKLMSDLSIRLGAQANPLVATFSGTGVPVGSRGNAYVSEFYLLSNDIDSDL